MAELGIQAMQSGRVPSRSISASAAAAVVPDTTPFDPIASARAAALRAEAATAAAHSPQPAGEENERDAGRQGSLTNPEWCPAWRHAAEAYAEYGAWLG